MSKNKISHLLGCSSSEKMLNKLQDLTDVESTADEQTEGISSIVIG